MATARPFAYNTGSSIGGTEQVGDLAVGLPSGGFQGSPDFWNGPDEELGYVIAYSQADGSHPTPVPGKNASLGFWRSQSMTDESFLSLVLNKTGQTFATGKEAKTWLNNNGYWTSYLSPVLSLDAGNMSSYPGSGTVWTDLVGGKTFNLINGPGYDSGNGGKIYFNSSSNQYAQCNTSLASLPTFTTTVWHNWSGTNSGNLPCILTEIYVGGPINYFMGNLLGYVAQGGYFNGGFQASPQFNLTSNTWYNIAVTCDSSQTVKIYINGTLISSTPTSGSQPSSSNAGIRLMRRWDDPDYWGGYLATVDIYDRAMSSSQVSSIFNTTKSRFGL